MESGTHSIWVNEQIQELVREVIVANVRELRSISHSDRKRDQADAVKLAAYARLDRKILRPISHRTVAIFNAGRSVFLRCAGTAFRTASRTMRRCTPTCSVIFSADGG